jgi:hypothetical protein
MIERLKPEPDLEQEEREQREQRKRKRALNHLEFDPGEVRKLERPAEGQKVYWDTKQIGLSILCSKSTRTYRATCVISHDKEHPDAGHRQDRARGRDERAAGRLDGRDLSRDRQ